jgi:hypothetical protein
VVKCSPHNSKPQGLSADTAAATGKNGKELLNTVLIIPAPEIISLIFAILIKYETSMAVSWQAHFEIDSAITFNSYIYRPEALSTVVKCSPHNPKVVGLSPDTTSAAGKNGKELIITVLIIPVAEIISLIFAMLIKYETSKAVSWQAHFEIDSAITFNSYSNQPDTVAQW